MSIYQNQQTGKWKVQVWYKGKRYSTKSFSKKALAEKYERDTIAQIESRRLTGSQAQDYTYDEIYRFWYANALPRKRDSSLERDVQLHRDFISPTIGELPISEISSIYFDKIVTSMIRRGLSKSSVNKAIQHFKAVFNS